MAARLLDAVPLATLRSTVRAGGKWQAVYRGFRPQLMTRSQLRTGAANVAADPSLMRELASLIATNSGSADMESAAESTVLSEDLRTILRLFVGGGVDFLPLRRTPATVDIEATNQGPEESDPVELAAPPPDSAKDARSGPRRHGGAHAAEPLDWKQPDDDIRLAQDALTFFGRSLSAFVQRRLELVHGDNWLKSGCSPFLDVWRGKAERPSEYSPASLFGFAETGDLKEIMIAKNNWPAFEDYFPDKTDFALRFKEIIDLRIAGAHSEQRVVSLLDAVGPIWSMSRIARAYHEETASRLDDLWRQATAMQQDSEPLPSPTLAARVATNLGDFRSPQIIGRESELATLRDFWNDPFERIASITGAGGVGKTALVSQFLNDLTDQPWPHDRTPTPEVIIYLTAKENWYRGIHQPDPESRRFANLRRIFEITVTTVSGEPDSLSTLSTDQVRTQALDLAKTSPILFVLDNLETLNETESPAVYRFVTMIPAPSKCILTTRIGRDIGRPIVLSGLPTASAKELFLSRLGEAYLATDNPEFGRVIDDVIRYANGSPLTIVCAAQMILDGYEPAELLSRLRGSDGLAFLEFAFESSVKTLASTAVKVLFYLALSLTDRSRKDLAFFADTDAALTTALSDLLSANLISRSSEDKKTVRFRVANDQIRDYINKRAPEILSAHDQSEIVRRADVQRPEAVAVQVSREVILCLKDAQATGSDWVEAARILDEGIRRWGRDPSLIARLGYCAYRLYERDRAITLLREAISLGVESPDSYFHLALCLFYESTRHEKHLDEALALAESALNLQPDHRQAAQLAGECLLQSAMQGRFEFSTDQRRRMLVKSIAHLEKSLIPEERTVTHENHNSRTRSYIDQARSELTGLASAN